MYKLLLAMALFISGFSISQDSVNKTVQQTDTSTTMNSYYDSLQKEDIQRMTERSANYFAELQRERNARQKKQAITYIAMGVAGFIVLIIGLRRRVKKIK